ncbi:MBL fold metallo-hydrolase [Paralimibaculum aggregatum]|uniref:MBL fold metallo-hydrolase n=1 Tax=Paralimibaculum aggregatum TaxID=3036245 RepID=A0ABQ6LMW8_9RHOB|nr:MBL fold metallo-hydrolase [Limibaculum sp. NKW23]GMG81786.1 MBL fold metallo-hydrolase [Limibaculum sp. NKW23]
MAGRLRFTILGCGSSGGVPRIGPAGPNWGACDPADPRNRRRRCALLVQRIAEAGTTTLLIDAGPDIRSQLIDAGAGHLDAVLFTHEHADHIHGIDDLRMVVFNRRALLPAWTDAATEDILRARFGYVFETPPGSAYPPILTLNRIEGPLEIAGAGGPIRVEPFWVPHGDIVAMGVRAGPVAYTPDISAMTAPAWAAVSGIGCWITDALRYSTHVSHANVETALGWIAQAAPRRAILTNLHVDLDYATLAAELPAGVEPAHDGLVLDYPA